MGQPWNVYHFVELFGKGSGWIVAMWQVEEHVLNGVAWKTYQYVGDGLKSNKLKAGGKLLNGVKITVWLAPESKKERGKRARKKSPRRRRVFSSISLRYCLCREMPAYRFLFFLKLPQGQRKRTEQGWRCQGTHGPRDWRTSRSGSCVNQSENQRSRPQAPIEGSPTILRCLVCRQN